jgi:hypothetical protein
VVIIGSGVGGLSCGAILARCSPARAARMGHPPVDTVASSHCACRSTTLPPAQRETPASHTHTLHVLTPSHTAALSHTLLLPLLSTRLAGAHSLTGRYGYKVTVCESHYLAGGAAHSFQRDGYTFDSGPSFYSGISQFPSVNPLGQVLHALDEPVDCITYDRWQCHLPEGLFTCVADADQYRAALGKLGGAGAESDWRKLEKEMEPLAEAAAGLPAAALRFDAAVALTLWKFLPAVLKSGPRAAMLQQPFIQLMDKVGVRNKFVRNMYVAFFHPPC